MKYIAALLVLPILALAHTDPNNQHDHNDSTVFFPQPVSCAGNKAWTVSGGCGQGATGGHGIDEFARLKFIAEACGGQSTCSSIWADRIYFVHVKETRPGKQPRHYHSYLQKTVINSGGSTQQWMSIHSAADFLGFEGDQIHCSHMQ